jgi:hypothetical protein
MWHAPGSDTFHLCYRTSVPPPAWQAPFPRREIAASPSRLRSRLRALRKARRTSVGSLSGQSRACALCQAFPDSACYDGSVALSVSAGRRSRLCIRETCSVLTFELIAEAVVRCSDMAALAQAHRRDLLLRPEQQYDAAWETAWAGSSRSYRYICCTLDAFEILDSSGF